MFLEILFATATKIEFFVGDVPDGTPLLLENARYTRLGLVAFLCFCILW